MVFWNFGYYLMLGLIDVLKPATLLDGGLTQALICLSIAFCTGFGLALYCFIRDYINGEVKGFSTYLGLFVAGAIGGAVWYAVSMIIPSVVIAALPHLGTYAAAFTSAAISMVPVFLFATASFVAGLSAPQIFATIGRGIKNLISIVIEFKFYI